LLREAYEQRAPGTVTREFNKQLAVYGIKGYQVVEYLPKLDYPTRTWYVDSTDENNWQIHVAVNACFASLGVANETLRRCVSGPESPTEPP
jgi:hypothetical protein